MLSRGVRLLANRVLCFAKAHKECFICSGSGENAEGATRPETPGGRDWLRRNGREDRHGRDNGRIEEAIREGPFWAGGGESARRRAHEGGTVGHRQKGGGPPLGLMADVLTRPDYARVKREAARLLRDFAVSEPPVDPAKIARELGVTVYFVKFSPDKQNVSGFFDCDEGAIFVNKDEWPLRQTFTIAHELGHKILHEEWARSSDYKVLLRDQDYSGDDPHEKEANAFAANLLVPRFMLDKYWKALTPEQLSHLFAVSVPVIKFRLASEYGI